MFDRSVATPVATEVRPHRSEDATSITALTRSMHSIKEKIMDDFKKDFFKDVRHIQEEMDLLFDHFYKMGHSPVLTSKRLWRPPTDVFETENGVIVLLEIAGMKQKDFSITLSDDILTVKGERKEKAEPSITGYRNKEINFGMFERNIYLPENIDSDEIVAAYKEGFLEITIKKRKGKKVKAKEIEIEEG